MTVLSEYQYPETNNCFVFSEEHRGIGVLPSFSGAGYNAVENGVSLLVGVNLIHTSL
jgi:hypothetical protein